MSAWATVAVSIGSVIIGWLLSEITRRLARSDQREQLRVERVRERQDEAAVLMDTALLEAFDRQPHVLGGTSDTAADLRAVQDEWRRGWVRSTVIDDPELNDRYAVVGMITYQLGEDLSLGRGVQVDFLTRALTNARRALAAFRREEPLPDPTFPGRALLAELVGAPRCDDRYEQLALWLNEHPEPKTG